MASMMQELLDTMSRLKDANDKLIESLDLNIRLELEVKRLKRSIDAKDSYIDYLETRPEDRQ